MKEPDFGKDKLSLSVLVNLGKIIPSGRNSASN
jgi:hypothetical protein